MGSLYDVLQELVQPLYLMLLSAIYLPGTLLSLLKSGQLTTLASPSGVKYAWFARFWAVYGPLMKENSAPRVAPLIGLARGVVLDIGPGSGEWIGLFDKKKVTKACMIMGCNIETVLIDIRYMAWSQTQTIMMDLGRRLRKKA